MQYRNQMIVSNTTVHYRPLSTYQTLLDLVTLPDDHPYHRSFDERDWRSTLSNPKYGHSLERAFSIAFGCYRAVDMRWEERFWCPEPGVGGFLPW
jgi:hypothetical protein